MNWSQPICRPCWDDRNPGREPYTINQEYGPVEPERCCYCNALLGERQIYIRVDPRTVPFPTEEIEERERLYHDGTDRG